MKWTSKPKEYWENLPGKIIVIVGPSGAGKSTLIKNSLNLFPTIIESISHTTRNPRPYEKTGEHYYFIQQDKFDNLKDKGYFLEWAYVHGKYYGTSGEFISTKLNENKTILLDIDVQGADNLKNFLGSKALNIFIAPPSLEDLEKRLKDRKSESEEIIQERLNNAKKEMQKKDSYDYLVINDELAKAQNELNNIIQSLHRNKEFES